MVASWPPTSGATRTSVARTTPVMGTGGSGRNRRYPPRPAATRTTPSTRIRRLSMGMSPLDHSRRDHGEREICERKHPKPPPITRHLPQGRAQLVDADDAVDREIRWEDGPEGLYRRGDR